MALIVFENRTALLGRTARATPLTGMLGTNDDTLALTAALPW